VENARALAWPVHYYYRNPAIGNNKRLVCRIDVEDSATKYLRIDNLVSSAVRIECCEIVKQQWKRRQPIGIIGRSGTVSLKKVRLGKG